MADSPLITYYRGTGTDHAGRQLRDVLAWDDDALEHVHDYVQWLFPNTEPSRANAAAPLLTTDDIAAFRRDPALQHALRTAFERMLAYYGLRRRTTASAVLIEPAGEWPARARHWVHAYNHNHLRLTRIMKCLHALGFEADARALQSALLEVAARAGTPGVSPATVRHWQAALEGAPVIS